MQSANSPAEQASASPIPPPLQTPKLFWVVIAALVILAFFPTIWTDLDLTAGGWFTGPHPRIDAGQWPWVVWVNAYIPTAFRYMLLVTLLLWLLASFTRYGKQWRMQLAFILIAGTLGPGAVVNLVFKDHWQRARPYQVQEFGGTQQFTRAGLITNQCDNNCSFVSGHTACGFFFVGLMLLHRKRRMVWALVGTAAGFLIGFARMADVAHWLSDVLWAGPITLLTSWIVWKLLLWVYKAAGPEEPTPNPTALPRKYRQLNA
jgi:lipid A 4'-phosphatase